MCLPTALRQTERTRHQQQPWERIVPCLPLRRRKGYHELNSGTLQMLVKPAACSGVLFDYASIPDIGTLVRARVTEIGESAVVLESGVELPFDYLVLAPGSTYADNAIKDVGGTAAERQALVEVSHSFGDVPSFR